MLRFSWLGGGRMGQQEHRSQQGEGVLGVQRREKTSLVLCVEFKELIER